MVWASSRSVGGRDGAVSLARPRRRPAWARCRPARGRGRRWRRPASARSVLPDRTRIPRRPTRWAAATSAAGRRRPSRRPTAARRSPRSACSPATAWRKTSADGLPRIVRPPAGRELEGGHDRAGVEGRPGRREPPRVAVHRRAAPLRHGPAGRPRPCCGTTGRRRHRPARRPRPPRRAAHPPRPRSRAAGRRTRDGRPRRPARNNGRPGWTRRGVGRRSRGPADDPAWVDRETAPAIQPARVSRCICEKLVTTRNGIPRSWRLRIASTEPGNGSP